MTPTPDPAADGKTFDKASRDALASIAVMYRECHAQNPDSELCAALQDVQKAVAEISSRHAQGDTAAPPADMAEAAAQMHAQTMAAAPQQGMGGGY